MHNFKELKVWQLSMDLAVDIYNLMKNMPREEIYALTSQIKRCSISIPSNLAEGCGRNTKADFARFIDIGNGSANELETQLILANRLGFLSNEQVQPIYASLETIQKMNYNLLKSLRM